MAEAWQNFRKQLAKISNFWTRKFFFFFFLTVVGPEQFLSRKIMDALMFFNLGRAQNKGFWVQMPAKFNTEICSDILETPNER